jgi:uncharacterized protein (TIGR03905 family)
VKYTYKTKGVCSSTINFEVEDDVITSLQFVGGCNGNLKGISSLCVGMKVQDVIERLEGAKRVMSEEKVNIRHIYMVWLQGETDAYLEVPEEEYIGEMQKMLFTLQPYGVERCFVIQIGNGSSDGIPFDCTMIQKTQEKLCEIDENFVLVSTLGKTLSEPPYMVDGIHFTQQALNILGEDAGTNAGRYVQSVTEGR